ncbi:MAG TPA: XRE family transcriptional regulator [Chloroflexia bacterium]|jgi:Zn-dependent peptidase ImmA (M78 family)/transcriptional regulator with XRE-family HTH domain
MDDNILETINLRELGKALQEARKKRGLTQEAAAQLLELARTTLVAIEKGERRIKAGELIKLSRVYGRQVSDFVRPRPQIESFQVQFRGPSHLTEEHEEIIAPYIADFEELCRDYLELDEITQSPLVRKYPSEYQIAGLRPDHAAEMVAIQERNRLDLGDGPIPTNPVMRDVLEQEVGLRIFFMDLPGRFSEIYHYDHKLGGCIAINSGHPEERRRLSLSHAYGHFLAHRFKPEVLTEDGYQRKPESEQFADAFSLNFLMPVNGITMRFNDIKRSQGKVTVLDLCRLAYYYGVSVQAIVLWLEDIKLLRTGTWDILQARGFKVGEARQQLGLVPLPERPDLLPKRYQHLALVALEKGLVSEGQFAHFLRVDRLEARRIAHELRLDTVGTEMDSAIIDFDLTQSAIV